MVQYDRAFTDALQFMWGQGFLSPGGAEEVHQMLTGCDIAGRLVLDIGSGLGGIDVLIARDYGASEVVGIDVEPQLVSAARELVAAHGLAEKIRFQLVLPGPLPFPNAFFDCVFSKDAMVHISNKQLLFTEIMRVLKPGGDFIAADWLWRENAAESPAIKAWMAAIPLNFTFTTVPEMEIAMRSAGFRDIRIEDRRIHLQVANLKEVEALTGEARTQLAALVGEDMANSRLASARGRQAALDSGDLIPCHLKGRKPDHD